MLLRRLVEYAERLALPPRLYEEAPVRYIVELGAAGGLLSSTPTDTADPASPRAKWGQRRLVPTIPQGNKIKPRLLADGADYTFGLAGEKQRPARVAECRRAYLEQLGRCAAQTGDPGVRAVLAFLSDDPLGRLTLGDGFDPNARITFRVEGEFPVERPAVQVFWAAEHDPAGERAKPAPVMQCVVCGETRPALLRLQGKVKGVPGGQMEGTAIISANKDAFESYGLEASLIAPTCAVCGEQFTRALSHLLASRESRLTLGQTAYVFWTREPVGFDLTRFLDQPEPEQVRALLESVRAGRPALELDATAFYAAALSAAGGRVVVRDWLDTTVGEARRHLKAWFEAQEVVGAFGEDWKPLGLAALAKATVSAKSKEPQKEIAPNTPRALLRAALTGAPAPPSLLYQAVRRIRAGDRVSRERAALIKLALLDWRRSGARAAAGAAAGPDDGETDAEEGKMIQLDPANTSPAYRCGRLLAVLEEVQRLAVPGAKATIVDRFYGTASSAPASVFGRLLRGAQPHLAKLERDRRGAYVALQRRLEEVQSGLSGFPRTLTLEEQGLFALGYYHQRAFDRAAAKAAAERRRAAGQAAPPAEEEVPDAELEDEDGSAPE